MIRHPLATLASLAALCQACTADDPASSAADSGTFGAAGAHTEGGANAGVGAPPWRTDFPADEYTEYEIDRTQPYECGGATCEPIDDGSSVDSGARDAFVADLAMDPCCTDTGGCGLTSATFFPGYCFVRDDPGVPDPGCPSENLVLAEFDGCCRPDGRCGIDASSFTAGCVERTAFSEALNSGQGASLMLTFEEVACTFVPADSAGSP
jgi:hypothetical protein